VVALTATEPPHEATRWTAAAMAEAVGISLSSVQRIWKAHALQPHRMRRFGSVPAGGREASMDGEALFD
jgi:hypothetical protein